MKNSSFLALRKIWRSRKVKRALNLINGGFLAICCFFGAHLMFQTGWSDLNEVDKFEGIIIDKGITSYRTSTSGTYRITSTNQAFYLKLKGLDQTLAVYNPGQKYGFLDSNLTIGDRVKVFYNYSKIKDRLNLETFQIEKNNQKILESQSFQSKERAGFYIAFLGGIALLFMTYYRDRNLRRGR